MKTDITLRQSVKAFRRDAFRVVAASLALTGTATAQIVPTASAQTIAAFRSTCRELAKKAQKNYAMTVAGRDGWLFFAPELRHVGAGKFWGEEATKASQSPSPENADPLPAILDFKAQLDRAGIALLLVPVPPKSVIYPDKVFAQLPAGAIPRLDDSHQEFYRLLRGKGVDVLDLTDEFIQKRSTQRGPMYCKQDTHWAGVACVVAAQRIAATIKDRPWLGDVTKLSTQEQWKRITIQGDLWKAYPLGGKRPAAESLNVRFIGKAVAEPKEKATALPVPIAPSKASPIVLLGDSHDLVFHDGDDMHTRGAGLPDQLLRELGFPVDLIAVRGSGATPARIELLRRARANPQYLAKKKLIVWCFSAREFTESLGWQKVPVVP